MSGQQSSEAVLARLRPSRLLSAHYYVLIFPLLMGAVSSTLGYFPGTLLDPGLRLDLSVTLAGLSFLFYMVSEFRRLSHRYTIYDQRVGIAEGVLRKRVQYMPYSRVERIEVNQSLIGRIFGIGNIVVDTGDDQMTLRAIRSPSKVEQLVSRQLRVTGTGFPNPFRQPA